MIDKANTPDYFAQAANWDLDHVTRSKQSEKTAWRVAAVALGTTVLSLATLAGLMPLKEVQYQIVRVDQTTGLVDVQRTLRDAKTDYGEVTDKYWLRLYTRHREGFDYGEYERNYRTVGLLSSPSEQSRWFEFYKAENPAAPINQLGEKAHARIKIRSITFLDGGKEKLANVRYTRTIEQFGTSPVSTYWIATASYRYVAAPESEDDREVNPLGFQITSWRIDPETDVSTREGGQS